MSKPELHSRHSPVAYRSYVVGFILSVVTTLLAYFLVVNDVWPAHVLMYVVLAIAVVQLIIQVVFFLHIGRGSRWKLITFLFTILIVAIVVVGSVWVMEHLNYNMMDMTPNEQKQYMRENQGL